MATVSSSVAHLLHIIPSFALVAGVAIACIAGHLIYQLHFHPLAKYPGPLLGRTTRWYDVYHSYVGDKHVLLHRLHERHGALVRFSPNTLSVNDPAALKAIYARGTAADVVEKSAFYKCFRSAPAAVSTLLATDKAQHARKRRVLSQAFSGQALRDLEQYVQSHVQTLVDRIDAAVRRPECEGRDGWSTALDMQKWCNWLAFDIMGELVFGKSFGTMGEAPANREGIRLLGRAARRNYTVAAMPSLATWGVERWLSPFRGLYRDRRRYLAFGARQVVARTEREKEPSATEQQRKDIFSFLLGAKDPETGHGFPKSELWMEGNTLIVAGSDTSSTAFAATLFYLLRNPRTLSRLQREIRGAFAHGDDIRMGPALRDCSWLRACIDESMRMSPAVAGLLPRTVLKGGLAIPALDLYLPAGVDVGVPIYAIQHHAAYVADPFTFDPARWLDEGTANDDDGDRDRDGDNDDGDAARAHAALRQVFHPFSLGNRACVGQPLVYMELSIALARLVWEFDMRPAPDQHEREEMAREVKRGWRDAREYHYQDWFLSNNWGPFVEFRTRDGA